MNKTWFFVLGLFFTFSGCKKQQKEHSSSTTKNKNTPSRLERSPPKDSPKALVDKEARWASDFLPGYEKLEQRLPAAARVHNLNGLKAHQKKNYTKSLALFQKAAAESPRLGMARFNAARALARLKREKQAWKILEELLVIDFVRFRRLVETDEDLASLRDGPLGSTVKSAIDRTAEAYRTILSRPGPKFVGYQNSKSNVWHYDLKSKRYVRLTDSQKLTLQWGITRTGSHLWAITARVYSKSKEASCHLEDVRVLRVDLGTFVHSKLKSIAIDPQGPVPELRDTPSGVVYTYSDTWGYRRASFTKGHNKKSRLEPKGARRMAMWLPSKQPPPAPRVRFRGKMLYIDGREVPIRVPKWYDKESFRWSPGRRFFALGKRFKLDCESSHLKTYRKGYIMIGDRKSGRVEVIHKEVGPLPYYWFKGGLVFEGGLEEMSTSVYLWQPKKTGAGEVIRLAAPGSVQAFQLNPFCQ